MHRLLTVVACLIVPCSAAFADDTAKPQTDQPKFELRDGDRVVFLGNTLIERAQKYGYWETMLTARYPDRDITFRNLGWSGDTVWAESRGMFDPPEAGYKRMIEQIAGLKPTVIFVGYGNNEAFAGKEGLPAFIKQYNKLLDDLTAVSAEGVRFVLLSPTWIGPQSANKLIRETSNSRRAFYRNKLRELSQDRNAYFVDLLEEMENRNRLDQEVRNGHVKDWTVEGFYDQTWQMTQQGYEAVGELLDFEFFLTSFEFDTRPVIPLLELDKDGVVKKQVDLKATNVKTQETGLTVDMTTLWLATTVIDFKIAGLTPGTYAVKTGQQEFGRADHITLSKGFLVDSYNSESVPGPNHLQYEKLRQAIIEKNRLYFYRWRPQNITYLFGFRKHEQGQNAAELAEFDKLIAEKEKEINRLKKPVAHTYEIIRVKEQPAEKQNDKQPEKP